MEKYWIQHRGYIKRFTVVYLGLRVHVYDDKEIPLTVKTIKGSRVVVNAKPSDTIYRVKEM